MTPMNDGKKVSRDAYVQAAATIVAAKITAAAARTHEPLTNEALADEFVAALSALREGVKKVNAQRKAARLAQQAANPDADSGNDLEG